MSTLWLTYSWKDNTANDVDFMAQEIKTTGVNVKLDRWDLAAGKRLWEQIGAKISDPSVCQSWGIYATQDSLVSEPCKEELYYALDRAISSRGEAFPIIGIFPSPIESSLIPPAIRIRLYVSLTDPDWKERVRAAVLGEKVSISRIEVLPYEVKIHTIDPTNYTPRAGLDGKTAIELRPRAGVWCPIFVGIPSSESERVNPELRRGPKGHVPAGCVLHGGTPQLSKCGTYWGMTAMDEATPTQSLYLICDSLPSRIKFGVNGGAPQYEINL